jgi:hypothetical protein
MGQQPRQRWSVAALRRSSIVSTLAGDSQALGLVWNEAGELSELGAQEREALVELCLGCVGASRHADCAVDASLRLRPGVPGISRSAGSGFPLANASSPCLADGRSALLAIRQAGDGCGSSSGRPGRGYVPGSEDAV